MHTSPDQDPALHSQNNHTIMCTHTNLVQRPCQHVTDISGVSTAECRGAYLRRRRHHRHQPCTPRVHRVSRHIVATSPPSTYSHPDSHMPERDAPNHDRTMTELWIHHCRAHYTVTIRAQYGGIAYRRNQAKQGFPMAPRDRW